MVWDAYPGAREYVLEFAVGPPASRYIWEDIATITGPPLEYVHQRPPISEVWVVGYRYTVITREPRAIYSEANNLVWGGGLVPALPAPTELQAKSITETSVELTWDEYPGVSEYVVQFADDRKVDWQWEEIARVPPQTRTLAHQNVAVDEIHVAYRHWAVTEQGMSLPSAPALVDRSEEVFANKIEQSPLATWDPSGSGFLASRTGPGTLDISPGCVRLIVENGETGLLVWPEPTSWNASSQTIEFVGVRGERAELRDGDQIIPGGHTAMREPQYVSPPDPSCQADETFIVNGMVSVNEPVLPIYEPSAPGGFAAGMAGKLIVEGPCLYLGGYEFGVRWFPVFKAGTVSWDRDALVLHGERYRIGERVPAGGGELTDISHVKLLQEPDESCDVSNAWVVNGRQ